MTNCGNCHECGNPLRSVLDGEEWCDKCGQYRRYRSHGWTAEPGAEAETPCAWGPQEPPGDYRIFNRRQADGTFRPLAEFFKVE